MPSIYQVKIKLSECRSRHVRYLEIFQQSYFLFQLNPWKVDEFPVQSAIKISRTNTTCEITWRFTRVTVHLSVQCVTKDFTENTILKHTCSLTCFQKMRKKCNVSMIPTHTLTTKLDIRVLGTTMKFNVFAGVSGIEMDINAHWILMSSEQ